MHNEREIRDLVKGFLLNRWKNQLYELAVNYPDTQTLLVDYRAIANYDRKLEAVIENNPEMFYRCASEVIEDIETPTNQLLPNVTFRLVGFPYRTSIREIGKRHINKTVCVEGIISRITDVKPKYRVVAYECLRCENVMYVPQPSNKFVEPQYCSGVLCEKKGPFRIDNERSTFADFQVLEIQETFEHAKDTQPRSIVIYAYDDMTDRATAGDKVLITGTVTIYRRPDKTFADIIIEGNYIEKVEKSLDELEISVEDLEEIKTLSQDPDIKNKIIQCIAPSIYGHDAIKEAAALQLFAGVPKTLEDNTRIRGDIHILLIGDPGTAKSQIVRQVTNLSPRGVFNSGKSSSSVGLTASVEKDRLDGERWTIRAGSLVLADCGHCSVDELDKMNQEDVSALHEAMEQQTITISKAGIHATLNTRCALLAAANPKYGRFDVFDTNIAGQINMTPTLLSRFDLIFVIQDIPDKERDRKIARHIAENHMIGGRLKNGNNGNQTIESLISHVPEIDRELLIKYIMFAKTNIVPEITEEAAKLAEDYYVTVRSIETQTKCVPITARSLEGIFRLAEANARLRLSKYVTIEDIEAAKEIVSECLKGIGIDPDTGMLDVDIIASGTSKSQRDKIRRLKDIIRMVSNRNYGKAPLEEVYIEAEVENIDREHTDELLKRISQAGDLVRPDELHVRVI